MDSFDSDEKDKDSSEKDEQEDSESKVEQSVVKEILDTLREDVKAQDEEDGSGFGVGVDDEGGDDDENIGAEEQDSAEAGSKSFAGITGYKK